MPRTAGMAVIAVVSVAMFSGCYGAKLVKGPVNSEHAALQADSLSEQNRRILRELAAAERRVEEEREARLSYQAQTAATLAELDETIRILLSRLEDSAQTQQTRRALSSPTPPAVVSTPVFGDTASNDSTASAPSAVGDPDELFRGAYLDVTRANYDLAIRAFQTYLVRYPMGPHVPDVHYYLGECYYASDRYLEAVPEFRYVVEKFPDSRLVPAAYLKSGRCYEALEEKNLAVRAYRALIDQHPDTEEAQQARDALAAFEG